MRALVDRGYDAVAERLARRFRVTGVDVSARQVALARAAVPAAIAGWLRPGGLLLANRRLLAAAGFTLLHDEVVAMREPGGDAAFQWVLGATA